VVVAFRSGSIHEWHALDKLRLRLLLTNSIVPLILCLLALLLVSVDPRPAWIWRLCSALALILTISIGFILGRPSFVDELKLGRGTRFLLISFGVLAVAAMILQIYNLAVLNAFWPFYATILLQLITGTIQFVRLILIQPHASQ
jgi:hypothetical protein